MKFSSFQRTLFFGLLLIVTIAFVWLIGPYIQPIFWAVVLVVVFYPVHNLWLRVTKGHKSISSILSMLSICVVILIPIYFIGQQLIQESIQVYTRLSAVDAAGAQSTVTESIKPVMNWLERFGVSEQEITSKISEWLREFSKIVATRALSVGQDALKFTIQFFVMLYVLYYLFKEGPSLVERLMRVIPLGDAKERKLFDKFAATTRATIKGTIIIGVVQGILGALMFWIVGIKGVVLWGALMTILAIIPAVGTGLVWAPAGIILLATGQMWQGVFVLAFGTVVIGMIDNILRPPLVGKDTEMPEVLVLLSTLGGLAAFGISGFVIGPVITAFFLAMWHMFEEEYRKELKKMG